jgi:DNA-binding GntR family transcriptional regulator
MVTSIRRIVPAVSLRADVEHALSAAIVSGELAPGSIVSVPTLAARFGVSATPVREAMLDLAKRGFVESVRNKGFRITEVSEEDLLEIVQIRRWLEVPAMGLLAKSFPVDQTARFRRLADAIVKAAGQGEFQEYLDADTVFHLEMLRLLKNDRLVSVVAQLRSQTRMVGLSDLRETIELEKSAQEHHLLLDRLAAHEHAGAEELMFHHIGHVSGWWAGRAESGSGVVATKNVNR